MNPSSLLFATALLLTTPVSGQCFSSPLGAALSMFDDSVAGGMPLGFSFPWPDGSTSSSIDIDSNGRILPAGADTTDPTPSVVELLGSFPTIAPLWDDLDPTNPNADKVYFHADPQGAFATVRWRDMTRFGGGPGDQFTFQVTLRPDGSFVFAYDHRVASRGLVGICGGNPTDPGPFDLSQALPFPRGVGGISTGLRPTAYEFYGDTEFDLRGAVLEWIPNGVGGYDIVGDGCDLADARARGVACRTPVTRGFLPNGNGGYAVADLGATFDPNLGTQLDHRDNTIQRAALGFGFKMPNQQIVNSLDVDSNGRLLAPNTDSSDRSPSLPEFLFQTGGMIAPFWTNWNPEDLDSIGGVYFFTDGNSYATVTWKDIARFGGSAIYTVQAQLHATGEWAVVLENTGGMTVTPQKPVLIGCTAGGGAANPGGSDFTFPADSGTDPTIFQFFIDSSASPYDLQEPPLRLEPTTLPQLGGSLDVVLKNVSPTATSTWMMIGFSNLNLDLSPVFPDLRGVLYASNDLPAQAMQTQIPGLAVYSLGPIPNVTSNIGIPLILQSAVVDPGANSLGVHVSNYVEGVVGF